MSMSIWIERMEMPPDGRYTVCVTHDSRGVVHWVFQNQDTLEFLKHGAVTEVQEPHGRLGDLDALPWYLANTSVKYATYEDWEMLCDAIAAAPTVIPASEDE